MKSMRFNKKGFTLIELLVVVLIIGILAAIAVPQYKHAALKSRFSTVMPMAKSIADAQEVYYQGRQMYALNTDELDVTPVNAENTSVTLSQTDGYDYVMAQNSKVPGANYIIYQKHSENYPSEIHCEAEDENADSQWLCAALGGQSIGEVLHSGYTTYVLSGGGNGLPYWAKDYDCEKAQALGFTCTVERDANGKGIKRMCMNNICRLIYSNEDGGYTSITCKTDANGVCASASDWKFATYDANGNRTSVRFCTALAEDGSCATYSTSGYDYIYDANGNKITELWCRNLVAGGRAMTAVAETTGRMMQTGTC